MLNTKTEIDHRICQAMDWIYEYKAGKMSNPVTWEDLVYILSRIVHGG